MTLGLRFAARSDRGLLREGNEDSVYAGPRLLAVADGMGGHAAGEVASAVAIGHLAPLDDDAPGPDLLAALRDAVLAANRQLSDMTAAEPRLAGMGTTLTALLSAGARLGLVHVGDSRAYLLRDGVLSQITHDHTLVQTLVDEGRLAPEEAASHPQRALITRVLDGRDVELDLSVREARDGDRYLLCSDGLSGVLSERTMIEALSVPDPQDAVDRLVELTLRGGAPDNVTCIVADVVAAASTGNASPVVGGAVAESSPPSLPSGATAAGRAALAEGRTPAPDNRQRGPAAAAGTAGPTARPRRRRRRRLAILAGCATVLLVVAGAMTIWSYARSQYYVGVHGQEVALYRGVGGSVAGIGLSTVQDKPGIAVDTLPPLERHRVEEGIPASSRRDAVRILRRLGAESNAACPGLVETVTPRPSPPDESLPATAAPTGVPTTSATGAPIAPTTPTTPLPNRTLPPGARAIVAETQSTSPTAAPTVPGATSGGSGTPCPAPAP